MKPEPKKDVDRSHFLPDDDRHITSYMIICKEPVTDGRECVIGMKGDVRSKIQVEMLTQNLSVHLTYFHFN